jgi:citronellol/citronellal dehydrogenase
MSKVIQKLLDTKALSGQVAIITGASRGIGRETALTFARAGAKVVVAAKSVEEKPNLPGTIYSVAKEIEALGSEALPVQVDVRDEQNVRDMVDKTIERFGRVDIMLNNAGALWWKDVVDTPLKRYDLMHGVNARGAFACTQAVLPQMIKQGSGRIIMCSPPMHLSMLKGKVAYCHSKFGMTMLAHGLAEEVADIDGCNITVNALWPATMVQSFATINFKLGDESLWRKAAILADAALLLVTDPNVNGEALIDEDYMRTRGVDDFVPYRCDPDVEPPRLTAGYAKVGKVGDEDNTVDLKAKL